MLNLSVNLMKFRFLLPFVLLLLAAQSTPPIAITFPAPDAIISGEVTVTGTTDIFGFCLFSIGLLLRLQPDRIPGSPSKPPLSP